MVAKITSPSSIRRALQYNEKKVQKGVATCIYAHHFLVDAKGLQFADKLHRFEQLHQLNERAKTNALHLSLNFDPSEKWDRETLVQIAADYMAQIGFGAQPYLVYQHEDAAHPHLHIVTTAIQESGRRINTYNIGRHQSQWARKNIEARFGLLPATRRTMQPRLPEESPATQKVRYGFSQTKQGISQVVERVVNHFHYTSLAELNAVLKQYNVRADKGSENSRVYQHRGLLYQVLDDRGRAVGVPLKASALPSKPTLDYLEARFKQNETLRAPHLTKLQRAIDWALYKRPGSLSEFVEGLKAERVHVELRRGRDGEVSGITFIDYRTKCVFTGSELGKGYSAAGIQERYATDGETRARSAGNAAHRSRKSGATRHTKDRAWECSKR